MTTAGSDTTRRRVDVVVWCARALVVTTLAAAVVSMVLIQRFGRIYDDALVIAGESALVVADSDGPVRVIADDLEELALVIVDTLERTTALLETADATLADVGDAATTNLADTADGAAAIADRIAGVVEFAELLIPGDTQSAAEELRAIADGLEPTADQLRDLGRQLDGAAGQLGDAARVVTELGAEIQAIADDIADLDPSLDRLAVAAEELEVRSGDAADRLDLDLWLARALVVLGAVTLVAIGVIAERLARSFGEVGPPAARPAPDPRLEADG